MQSDPVGLEGGENSFIYVGGNPLIKIDQLGKIQLKYFKWFWNKTKMHHISTTNWIRKGKFLPKYTTKYQIKKLINKTIASPDIIIKQKDGKYLYQKKFPYPIGRKGEKVMKVVLKDDRKTLNSAFPSKSIKKLSEGDTFILPFSDEGLGTGFGPIDTMIGAAIDGLF